MIYESMSEAGKDSLREAIIATAIEIGTELGEEALTMRAIARRLDVGATTLYQHFDSKGAILEEVWIWGQTRFNDALNPCFEADSCHDALVEACRRYVRFARENPWLYDAVMVRIQPEYARMDPETHMRCASAYLNTIDYIAAAVKSGKLPDTVVPAVAAVSLWSSMHGITALLLSGRFSTSSSTIVVRDADKFLDNYFEKIVGAALHCAPAISDPKGAVERPEKLS